MVHYLTHRLHGKDLSFLNLRELRVVHDCTSLYLSFVSDRHTFPSLKYRCLNGVNQGAHALYRFSMKAVH